MHLAKRTTYNLVLLDFDRLLLDDCCEQNKLVTAETKTFLVVPQKFNCANDSLKQQMKFIERESSSNGIPVK